MCFDLVELLVVNFKGFQLLKKASASFAKSLKTTT